MRKYTFTFTAMLALAAAPVNASSIENYYVDIFGGCTPSVGCPVGGSGVVATTTAVGSATLEPGGTVNTVKVPQFNSSLGTLNNVTLLLDWTFTGGVDVTNDDHTATHSFTGGFFSIPLTITGPNSTTASSTVGLTNQSGIVPMATLNGTTYTNWTGVYGPSGLCTLLGGTYNGGNNTCFLPTNPPTYTDGEWQTTPAATVSGNNGSGSVVTGAGLAAFTAPGFVTFTYSIASSNATYGGSKVGGTNHLRFGGFGTGGAVLDVQYDYTAFPTPEPASLSLVGGILLAGGAFWRRASH